MADELEEARLVAEAAEAARKRAQHDIDQAQEKLANLQKEEQTRKVRSKISGGRLWITLSTPCNISFAKWNQGIRAVVFAEQ